MNDSPKPSRLVVQLRDLTERQKDRLLVLLNARIHAMVRDNNSFTRELGPAPEHIATAIETWGRGQNELDAATCAEAQEICGGAIELEPGDTLQ